MSRFVDLHLSCQIYCIWKQATEARHPCNHPRYFLIDKLYWNSL